MSLQSCICLCIIVSAVMSSLEHDHDWNVLFPQGANGFNILCKIYSNQSHLKTVLKDLVRERVTRSFSAVVFFKLKLQFAIGLKFLC